ncbi:hypothetical protein KEM48_002394 [Puccinia striiformis f. sp. tritici PST-130]|nr:hypothetical protein KEM48_002394 [Puccinia striiformis f. sp. tritici PST-130]
MKGTINDAPKKYPMPCRVQPMQAPLVWRNATSSTEYTPDRGPMWTRPATIDPSQARLTQAIAERVLSVWCLSRQQFANHL